MCCNVMKPNVYYAMPRGLYTKLCTMRSSEVWMQVTATTLQWPQQDLLYIYTRVSPKVSSMHNCTWVQYTFDFDLCSYLGHIMPWCTALCCHLFLATIYSIGQDLSPYMCICIWFCVYLYFCVRLYLYFRERVDNCGLLWRVGWLGLKPADPLPLYVFVFNSVCICICISGRGGQLSVCFGGLVGWAWSRRSSPLIRRESWASAQSMPAHSGGPLGHAPAPTPVGTPKYAHPVPVTQKYKSTQSKHQRLWLPQCGMCNVHVNPKICPHHYQGQPVSRLGLPSYGGVHLSTCMWSRLSVRVNPSTMQWESKNSDFSCTFFIQISFFYENWFSTKFIQVWNKWHVSFGWIEFEFHESDCKIFRYIHPKLKLKK